MAVVTAQYGIAGRSTSEISETVERAVAAGRLRPGDRLPTVRGPALELVVIPATVSAAYQALRGRGVLTADGRRGTAVSSRPPLPHAAAPLPTDVLDLSSGNPDPTLLPDLQPALGRLAYRPRGYRGDQDDSGLLA